MAERRTLLDRLFARAVLVQPEERKSVLLACVFGFLVMASYFVLKPIRDDMAAAGGLDRLGELIRANFVVMLGVQLAFAGLVGRFARHGVLKLVFHAFALAIAAFAVLFLRHDGGAIPDALSKSFYVFANVFNLFILSLVWATFADVFRPDQALRVYGIVALGLTVGGSAGAVLATALIEVRLRAGSHVMISAVILEAALLAGLALLRGAAALRGVNPPRSAAPIAAPRPSTRPSRPYWSDLSDGIALVISSPFLWGIAGYLILYSSTSTFVYLTRQHVTLEAFGDDAHARRAFFAWLSTATQWLTLVLQLLVTGRVLRRFGAGVALAVLPLFTFSGFLAVAGWPVIAVVGTFEVLRNGANYTLAKPAREGLFTVVSRDERYKAKTFIDTIIYRLGDVIASYLSDAAAARHLALSTTALLPIPLTIVWFFVALGLGRARRRRAEARASADDAAPVIGGGS